jgi:hypothetical protein
VTERPDVMAVDPAVLKRFMLDELYERVEARLEEPLPEATDAALAQAPAAVGCGDARLARVGYLTRVAETERFERAREAMPWLTELARADDEAAATATRLALAEPLDKPDPDDPAAMTWRVPGPGGHVRHLLAVRWSPGGSLELKRCWLYGFFLRCAEEALDAVP